MEQREGWCQGGGGASKQREAAAEERVAQSPGQAGGGRGSGYTEAPRKSVDGT